MKKKILALVMVLTLSLSSLAFAEAEELNGVAYDDLTLEEISQLENISLSFDEETVELSFTYLDRDFSVEAQSFESSNGITKYTSEDGSVVTNILAYEGSITGKIFDSSLTIEERYNNNEDNFSFSITNSSSLTINSLSDSLSDLKDTPEIKSSIDSNLSNLNRDKSKPMNVRRIHVQASGWDIPFFLDGGFAEGWVSSTQMHENTYNAHNLSYNVVRNWPSDGVVLWYNNTTEAWRTPAFVSPGLTNVSGSWDINIATGVFQAEATVSLAIQGVPIFHTVYDESALW